MTTRAAAAAADQAQDDADAVVAEVDVDVRRARLLRSGGADDALPPTLKIDGDEESGEGRLLEAPVVVVVRHGDAAFSSSVITRSSGLRRVQLRCAFKCASARQSIVIEVRGAHVEDPTRGPLFGRRELSLFELAERDAEDELRRLRRACAGPGGRLRPLKIPHQVIRKTTPSSTGASTVVRGPPRDHHTRTAPGSRLQARRGAQD